MSGFDGSKTYSTYQAMQPSAASNQAKGIMSVLDFGQSTMKLGQTSGTNQRMNHLANPTKPQAPQKSYTVGYIPTEQDINILMTKKSC